MLEIYKLMMDIINNVYFSDIPDLLLFVSSAFIGMLFAYYYKWSWHKVDKPLIMYLSGDKHAIGRALTTLALLCITTESLSYLEQLDPQQILIAGLGIGTMVPSKVAEKEESSNVG